MKQFVWKLLFSLKLKSMCKEPFSWCWYLAESWVEMLDDVSEDSPFDCAIDEVDSWKYCI